MSGNSLNSDSPDLLRDLEQPATSPSGKETTASIVSFNQHCFTDKVLSEADQAKELISECSAVWIDIQGRYDREFVASLVAHITEHDQESVLDELLDRSEAASYKLHNDCFVLSFQILSDDGQSIIDQISLLQKGNTVVTVHCLPLRSIDRVKSDIRAHHFLMHSQGRLYIVQRFVEGAIDRYGEILKQYSCGLEAVEDVLLLSADRSMACKIHQARKELVGLKRRLIPLKDALRRLVRDSRYYASDNEKLVAQDLLDHATLAMENVEYFIALTSDLMSLHMSSVSNRMNEVMTVLAIVAAIFLPPTLISGIYGMNFYQRNSPWNMPELTWELGYPFALGMMAFISISFLLFFWKNGWLKVFCPPSDQFLS